MVIPDPRPEARHVADRDEWAQIAITKHGPCRGCGSLNIELHHLVPRSQRGSDVAANIVPLCPACHRCFTDRGVGWEGIAASVRCSLSPVESAYVIAVKSRSWLDRFYPKGDTVLCSRCKRPVKKPEKLEAPRKRKRWVLSVPDDAEDGADVLDGLVQAHRERLAPVLGWSDDVGAYFVVSAVLAEALNRG